MNCAKLKQRLRGCSPNRRLVRVFLVLSIGLAAGGLIPSAIERLKGLTAIALGRIGTIGGDTRHGWQQGRHARVAENPDRLHHATAPPRFWCSGRMDHVRKTRTISKLPSKRSAGSVNETLVNHFLSAVVAFRTYDSSPARQTTTDLIQWLQYMSYAGVEHVYVYDGAFLSKNESQKDSLKCFIRNGFLSYVDWSRVAAVKANKTLSGSNHRQLAYQDCLDKFSGRFIWQTALDIDEYPFCPEDRAPGFLARFVRKTVREKKGSFLGEIEVPSVLFLGKPLNASGHPLLIDRYWRRSANIQDNHVKPIYLSRAVRRTHVHRNTLKNRYTRYSPNLKTLRINHYVRNRPGIKIPIAPGMIKEDHGMNIAVKALSKCLNGCKQGCC